MFTTRYINLHYSIQVLHFFWTMGMITQPFFPLNKAAIYSFSAGTNVHLYSLILDFRS